MSRWGNGARAAFVVGCLVAALVGWFGGAHVGASDHHGTAAGAVNIYSCPMQGAVSIGQLHTGDAVWLMGVSDHRWAVIRHPNTPDRPAWVPLAMIDTTADVGELPELGCDANPVTGTSAPATTVPPSTLPGATTTLPAATTSTSTTTTEALQLDHTPPTVTLNVDRKFLFVSPAPAQCPEQDTIIITVVVVDPTLPLQVAAISADWQGAGSPPPATLTALTKNQWSLVITGAGPASGEIPVTITATARDGAGNLGKGSITVSLRAATQGCG